MLDSIYHMTLKYFCINHILGLKTSKFCHLFYCMALYWSCLFVCLFVCFVALCPKSTAMVMVGQSVHQTTLFPRQA